MYVKNVKMSVNISSYITVSYVDSCTARTRQRNKTKTKKNKKIVRNKQYKMVAVKFNLTSQSNSQKMFNYVEYIRTQDIALFIYLAGCTTFPHLPAPI